MAVKNNYQKNIQIFFCRQVAFKKVDRLRQNGALVNVQKKSRPIAHAEQKVIPENGSG